MAKAHAVGGDPNNTSGNFSASAGNMSQYVYTPWTMVTTRTDRDGNRPIRIVGAGLDYVSNGRATYGYQGVIDAYPAQFGSSGGEFTLRAITNGGSCYFGRNTGNGQNTTFTYNGYVWGGGLCGWIDYIEVPSAPQAFAVSRSGTSLSFSATGSSDNGGGSISAYRRQMQVNGGSWGSETTNWGTAYTGALGSSYRFRLAAQNECGVGPWTYTATITVPNVPGAPASLTTSRSGRDVTVTVTAPTSNGGSAITGYRYQYSINGGTSWSTAVSTTALSYTYTGLTMGESYLFRVYAVNAMGNGATRTSAAVVIPPGFSRYTGSAWTDTTFLRRYSGSAWVDTTFLRRWNGTAWVDVG